MKQITININQQIKYLIKLSLLSSVIFIACLDKGYGQCATCSGTNTFTGTNAGDSNTTGSRNSFFGEDAGKTNTIGFRNSFFGENSGFNNIAGSNNSFFGNDAGFNNTNGFENSYFGQQAGFSNTLGIRNSFFGYNAGLNTTGNNNSFFGTEAGLNTSGNNNSFFGQEAGLSNTTGGQNSFFGEEAGTSNTTGFSNSSFGQNAGANCTTGVDNSHFGEDAGAFNITGRGNSSFGHQAGVGNTTGDHNSYFGNFAGVKITSGSSNICIGKSSGPLAGVNPSSELYIDVIETNTPLIHGQFANNILTVNGDLGIGTTTPAQKLDVIGAIKVGNTSTNINGSIRYNGINFQGFKSGNWVNLDQAGGGGGSVWNLSGSAAHYTNGNVGIGTSTPATELEVNGDVTITGSIVGPSDLRLKSNIADIKNALDIIKALSPKKYNYKNIQEFKLPTVQQYGLVAQEVEKVLPSIVISDALIDQQGKSYKGIDYQKLIPILTQGIKELSDQNLDLIQKNIELQKHNSSQDKTISDILIRLNELEGNNQ